MFKQFVTLIRGRSVDQTQVFLDANAVPLLRQQMRDAAHGVEKSRKAVALVMAYADRERNALTRIESQIKDLEIRALAALEDGDEPLATEAAGTIAQLEAERDTTRKAISVYDTQIARLKSCLAENQTCLRDLQRGQHLAEANEKVLRLNNVQPSGLMNDLTDAADTLKRLHEKQALAEATATAMVELSVGTKAEDMSQRLADAGHGAPLKTSADMVLERLKKKAKK